MTLSRRKMLQITMALAPAALATDSGVAQEVHRPRRATCAPPSPACIPARRANSSTRPTTRETPSSISRMPDTAAGERRFPPYHKETIWPVAGDNTANVQAAIDKVSALPADKSGFRGAVLLRAGYYKMATPVRSRPAAWCCAARAWAIPAPFSLARERAAAAPALRWRPAPAAPPARCRRQGRGPGGGQPTLIKIAGASGWVTKDETKQPVADDYVPVGSRTIRVASARGFKAGDTVIVRRIGNQDWIDAMGMNGNTPGPWTAVQRRLGPRRGRGAGQHDPHRCAHHLRH